MHLKRVSFSEIEKKAKEQFGDKIEFSLTDKIKDGKIMIDQGVYDKRVYNGFRKADANEELRLGPNIKDWPRMYPLGENVLLKLAAVIHDEVTTTDELIPSGETSSYRSNPIKLSEFTLSRRVPEYVLRSKAIRDMEDSCRTVNIIP